MILRIDRWQTELPPPSDPDPAAAGIEAGEHKKLYRFSPADYQEIVAVFNGPHPETGEDLEVVDEAPAGFPPVDLPSQPAVFAPDYAPEEIAEIARNLRKKAGLGDEPTGVVAN
jgi:Mn-containing catalase